MIMNSTLSLKISSHPKVKIDTIAEINPDRISPKSRPQRIKYVDIGNVDRGQILKYVEVDLEEAPSRAQRVVKPNDVIISTVRPGNQAYAFLKAVPESMVVSTGFAVLRAKGCDPRYLYYWLTSDPVIDYLASIADEKSAYPSINPSDIGDLEIPLPPLETQREIAHVLGTLDDKIELNRRMNKTLEEIAQALFKHWFIDFEFPNEEGKPYKTSGGEMVDSELGQMPKGWKVVSINDLSQRMSVRIRYKKEHVSNTGKVPVFDQSSDKLLGYHDMDPDIIASSDKPIIVFGDHTCTFNLINVPFSCLRT